MGSRQPDVFLFVLGHGALKDSKHERIIQMTRVTRERGHRKEQGFMSASRRKSFRPVRVIILCNNKSPLKTLGRFMHIDAVIRRTNELSRLTYFFNSLGHHRLVYKCSLIRLEKMILFWKNKNFNDNLSGKK